ncbi:DUF86 domain-containing protein [Paenibacillus sp. GSMTC-2017]|uniref:DUF86 domain-containing protein n=1 Tax=Paenibacillus sp. GSMTC-2017 TaxID=2794350 RepID=UPI0018D7B49D|nr:HepT-like ribonuclease domain-containing protein [Paenibacillus sp. GSMTC-2017]MBH5318251.1 DUF86 domain-containing protein [Paenibacillus sp. GSMTC-2017]
MYYVNQEQIAVRLNTIPELSDVLKELASDWQGNTLQGLAQERALHLAIEIVTDVGSYLIDGFLMRDASSYEDIIEITGAEGAFPVAIQETLIQLVKLRKPIVQDYYTWQRNELHPLTGELVELLPTFKLSIERYLEQELK